MRTRLQKRDLGALLDRSTAQLDRDTLNRLRDARRMALQHQRTSQHVPVLAWLHEHGPAHASRHKSHHWGLVVLFAIILFSGIFYWQHAYEHDHSDIDTAILTDDLPVDMYVD
jgi:hypothetical protein